VSAGNQLDGWKVRRIAAAVLGEHALAGFDEVDLSPDPIEEAAFLYARILRDHPFPRGNRSIGYECMRELLWQSRLPWPRRGECTDEIVAVVKAKEAGKIGYEEFADWIRSWVARDGSKA
jgi:prophage maintenance system killer protein